MHLPLLSCSLALDDNLITTLLLTLTRSRMTTGGAGREGGGGPQVPGQQQGENLILHNLRVAPYIEGEI